MKSLYFMAFLVLVACKNDTAGTTNQADSLGYYRAQIHYYDSMHTLYRAKAEADNNSFDSAARLGQKETAFKYHDQYLLNSSDARRYDDSVIRYMGLANKFIK